MKRLPLLLVVLSSFAQLTFGTQRWVRTGGSNGASGVDSANAWQTIAYGCATMSSGDTLWICAGTYAQGGADPIEPKSGRSATERTCIFGRPGTITITGAGTGITISDKSYIDIDGYYGTFTFSSFGTGGFVEVSTANRYDIKISHCTWDGDTGANGYTILITNYWGSYYLNRLELSYLTFSNFTYNCGSGEETDAVTMVGVHDGWIHHNTYCQYQHFSGVNTFNCSQIVDEYNTVNAPTHGYLGGNHVTSESMWQYNFFRGGGANSCTATSSGGNGQWETDRTIVRFNRSINDSVDDGGRGETNNQLTVFDDNTTVRYNAIYHNVFWSRVTGYTYPASGNPDKSAFGVTIGGTNSTVDTSRILNNVITFGGTGTNASCVNIDASSPSIYWDGNRMWRPWDSHLIKYGWGSPTFYTLAQAQSAYPSQWGSLNTTGNPVFTDTTKGGGYGFELDDLSPCIDAAVALTAVTVNSSSTTVNVGAAYMFWPGNSFVAADSIKIGTTNAVGITARDIEGRTLTISSARNVTAGDGIYLWKNGAVINDVGAVQYSGVAPPLTPGVPTISGPTGLSRTTFTANWSAVDSAAGYRLDVATDAGFTSYVSGYQDRAVDGTSCSLSDLTQATVYYYRVRSYNGNGTSSNSSTESARTFRSLRGHR